MDIENMPENYSGKKVDSRKFVRHFIDVQYWGKERQPFKKQWAKDSEDIFPNEINVIGKKRDLSVMGFGGDFSEAYYSCLVKLEERLDRRGWDFILIGNGVQLKNGANFQYHMSATLYKINLNYK